MHHIAEQTLHLYHVLDTWQMCIIHRMCGAQANAYDFIDEAARLKLMYHIVEQTLHLKEIE